MIKRDCANSPFKYICVVLREKFRPDYAAVPCLAVPTTSLPLPLFRDVREFLLSGQLCQAL